MARVLQAKVQDLHHFTSEARGLRVAGGDAIIRLCGTEYLPLPTFLINGAKTSPPSGFVGRRDRKIPSADDLPKEELLDHLPYLLDTLIKQLRVIKPS